MSIDYRTYISIGLLSLAISVEVEFEDGCKSYIEHDEPLIAHAGGGLPDSTYTNSRRALDLAVSHGFKLIELDFMESNGVLLIAHDSRGRSDLSLEELFDWLDENPGIRIVTDIKTGNHGLRFLAHRTDQFVPQIYEPDQFEQARNLGFEDIIFTAYEMPHDSWRDDVNRLDLIAVTIPKEKAFLAYGVRHPIYLHTINEPVEGFGLYTDCLIPGKTR